ncbi:hypothetical protein F5Y04DRAFT_280862 [Hypomontagnella monticulosa]|nr:hypothetical protein F5Y04DRAFT_280862 [Hypomontagnella monticulosa]
MAGGERRRSFGIGGAGNIRTREEAMIHDIESANEVVKRRKSSLMSMGSISEGSLETKSPKLSMRFKNFFTSRPKPIPEVTKSVES